MNISKFDIVLSYERNGVVCTAGKDTEIFSFETAANEKSVIVKLKTKCAVKLLKAELIFKDRIISDSIFFENGYQSWTKSREFRKGDRQKGINFPCNLLPIGRVLAGATGDYEFTRIGKNLYHSHTYTYFRRGEFLELIGSLNDRTGYTIFYADYNSNVFSAEKDLEGVTANGEYELFNLFYAQGDYDSVFDAYFDAYPAKKTGRIDHLAGYTSWYNYFQNIDSKTMMRDLNGLYEKMGDKANIFQIDDGYETMVGDWFSVDKNKFPEGMRYMTDEIHKRNYLAGLWVAPFSAQFKANLVKEHPDWFLKDKKGKMLIGGMAWNGFYVLDIEKPEVRDYIKRVFDMVFNDWGFDMVKLDFLYSVAIIPRNGKSRGQLMFEAMDFLRECCGDKLILGCGVPLSASFGIVDACRISCDVELSYKEKFYTKITAQEILSAKSAMNNSVFRRHLNGRIFANDPDVFFLRDDGFKPAVFTMEQKKVLAKVNNMFGDVLFVSDNIGNYDSEKLEILAESYKKFDGKIITAEYVSENKISVLYEKDGNKREFTFDLVTGESHDILKN